MITTLVITFTACTKDENTDLYVDENLQYYFELFKEEGAKRNVTVDYQQIPIEGFLQNIEGANIRGQCQKNEDEPNKLIIDIGYWAGISTMTKEFIVFHELGHCYLKRSHLDDKDSTGRCLSIMHSSGNVCINAYSRTTRTAYLDELFSTND